jgi:hypothetical protein
MPDAIIVNGLPVRVPNEVLALETMEDAEVVVQVENDLQFRMVGEALAEDRALDKRIEEMFKPMREASYSAWQAVLNREKLLRGRLKKRIDAADRALIAYKDKIEAEEKRLAEEEAMLAAVAEDERRREEDARRAALADAPMVVQLREEAAMMAERRELRTLADAPLAKRTLTIPNASVRERWVCTGHDWDKALHAIADGTIALDADARRRMVEAVLGTMNEIATKRKGAVEWPGITVEKVKKTARR